VAASDTEGTLKTMKMLALGVAFVAGFGIASYSTFGHAQDPNQGCQKVADCAQKLVEIANKLVETNQQLSKRISQLENELAQYKTSNDSSVSSRAQQLQTEITKMSQNLLGWGLGQIQPPTPDYAHGGVTKCDPGYYVVGADFIHTTNGLDAFKFLCNKLNPALN
jgi:hypothetical protein